MSEKCSNDYVTLHGGVMMPRIGFGTFPLKGDELYRVLGDALDVGYRLIDTAYSYENQETIGKLLKAKFESGQLKREELFITTKVPGIFMESSETVRRCMDLCLSQLQLDYVDLCLIHTPCGIEYVDDETLFPTDENGKVKFNPADPVKTWKSMEALVDAGLTRAIGVSNFNVSQLERVVKEARVPVACHQVECHVYLQQRELRRYCESKGIYVTAFGPLGAPGRDNKLPKLVEDPIVLEISKRHQKSPAQVLLRFLLRENITIIPKSANRGRMGDNLNVASFDLKEEDMEHLRKLDKGIRYYDFIRIFGGHPDYPFVTGQ